VPGSLAQRYVVLPWFKMRPGPGSSATELIAGFDVGGTQNAATPTGYCGSATPCAEIVGYDPDVGESFQVATFGSLAGGFSAVDGADFAPDKMFALSGDADSLDLGVVATGP
jgi:hypothetical protein